MHIQGFNADILSVKYSSFVSSYSKETNYICSAMVKEIGKGLARANRTHNVKFYLEECDYNDRILDKGDRVSIFDTADWHFDGKFDYKSTNPKNIEKADKSQLQVLPDGKTAVVTSAFGYSLRCKQKDYDIVYKYYDKIYCAIHSIDVKLPLESKEAFKSDSIDFFLDDDEMEQFKKLNGKIQTVYGYYDLKSFGKKEMLVHTERQEGGANYLLLVDAKE